MFVYAYIYGRENLMWLYVWDVFAKILLLKEKKLHISNKEVNPWKFRKEFLLILKGEGHYW